MPASSDSSRPHEAGLSERRKKSLSSADEHPSAAGAIHVEGRRSALSAPQRHIGNGFLRPKGLPVKGSLVTWPQVHIFPRDGLVVEHWAVRDDATMLDSVTA